jgi:hypothetical protein
MACNGVNAEGSGDADYWATNLMKAACALFAVAALWAAMPVAAGNMGADEARQFVVGNPFSFTCFEGTSGEGRVNADGSAGGVIRLGGSGVPQYATLPPGTLRVRGDAICALISGPADRGLLRSRSHRSKELPRFGRCNEPARVLPLHQAIYPGRLDQHFATTLYPTDWCTLKSVISLRPATFNPLVTIPKLRGPDTPDARYIFRHIRRRSAPTHSDRADEDHCAASRRDFAAPGRDCAVAGPNASPSQHL